jgi:DNA-3-methyladenine glycosylase II
MDEHLMALRADPKLAPLIEKYGQPALVRSTGYFQALVRSIIYQQVTGKAAASIMARFEALFHTKKFPTPAQVREKSVIELRNAGLSNQKALYIHDLAEKFSDGHIRVKDIPKMANEEIIEHLIEVKGIGTWTAHMFLIFTLGRPDVLPVGDYGVRKGMQVVYGMKKLPTPKQMEWRARAWRAHSSVASWYFWQVANETKPVRKKKLLRKK